jgi:hypothetical protein
LILHHDLDGRPSATDIADVKTIGRQQPSDVAAPSITAPHRSIFNPLLVEIVANWRIRMIAHFTASVTFNF